MISLAIEKPARQEVEDLDRRCAQKRGKPIYHPLQMTQKLRWDKMDAEWRMQLTRMFWATNYEGSLKDEFCAERFPHAKELLKLRDRILAFGGEEVCLPALEDDLEDLQERGQFWYGQRAKMMKGEPCQCHRNACNLWSANIADEYVSLHIATGYALSQDGMWRQHSWLVWEKTDRNVIVETTEPRVAYFGFVMTNEEAEKFCWEND